MRTYTIFLAASNELATDRLAFGDIVQQLNDRYAVPGRYVYFRLYKWERDLVSFAERRKQDEYNSNIENCALFVMLYGSKVGEYTHEEYDFAYTRFVGKGQPRVLVFKKEGAAAGDSVIGFEEKIRNRDQQFKSRYNDIAVLRNNFLEEIQKLFEQDILQYGKHTKGFQYDEPAKNLYNDGQNIPSNFKSREAELKDIREKLEEGGRLMLINAEGGIGKTTIAAKYWQDSLFSYRYNAWLFCENGIVNELKKLAPELKVDISNMPEDEQLQRLKAALQNISHSFLLVLDNANNEDDIIAFKQTFSGLNWHVLITSRCNGILEPAQEYHINHLPPPLAKALFKDSYQEKGADFEILLDRLLAAIDYNTLLIEVFSKNLREASELGETLESFIKKLEEGHLYLSAQDSFEVVTTWTGHNKHMHKADANKILDVLYDFTSLAKNEDEQYLLVNLSLLPAVPYTLEFLSTLFTKWDKRELRDHLKALTGKGWLSFANWNYKLSQVIQQLALKKNEASLPADAVALIYNLNARLENDGTYLKYFNEAGPYADLTESITRQLISKSFHELGLLNFNSCVFYISTGNLLSAQASAENFQAICEQLKDQTNLALSYSMLGEINETFGRLELALEFYEHYSRSRSDQCRDYPANISFKKGLSTSYSKLGDINEKLGRLEQALQYYRNDAKLSEELHRDYPTDVSFKNGLAISYEKLGKISDKLGRLEQALQYHEDEMVLFDELHRDYPTNASFKNGLTTSYSKLGTVNEKLGKLERALQYYEDDARLSEELQLEYPGDVSFKNGLAISWAKIASLLMKKGENNKALDLFRKAEKDWIELTTNFPLYAEFTTNLARVKNDIAILINNAPPDE